VSRFQPLRPKSYLFKNCVTGLVLATLVSTQPSIAQVDNPVIDPPPPPSAPPKITNQAEYEYNDPGNPNTLVNGISNKVIADPFLGLTDPLGKITGCDGKKLPNYKGFSVGLYEAAPNKLDLAAKLVLPITFVKPNIEDRIPTADSIAPNLGNENPYKLLEFGDGQYNFLFSRDQIVIGKSYIIVVNAPPGSSYGERRVRIDLTSFNNGVLSYRATSLDGKPIKTSDETPNNPQPTVKDENGLPVVIVNDAARIALVGIGVCDNDNAGERATITKSADRATAEVGDTVVYRIALKNNSRILPKSNDPDAPKSNDQDDMLDPIVTDTLPLGMTVIPNSVKAQIYDDSTASLRTVPVTLTKRGDKTCFQIGTVATNALVTSLDSSGLCSSSRSLTTVGAPKFVIPSGKVVNLVYAVTLDTDAIRGTGKNVAKLTGISNNASLDPGDSANFRRDITTDEAFAIINIRQGLIRDTGTLIGRVFVDKNFDGQQQPNEPGIPNAVIFMDDGNRITTDLNGLFSVQSVVAGYRAGALDLSSLPGYSLAPNLHFSERNSRSRLVKLAPGGIARMNFGVTPTAREVK
jgi:hypothetical protein